MSSIFDKIKKAVKSSREQKRKVSGTTKGKATIIPSKERFKKFQESFKRKKR